MIEITLTEMALFIWAVATTALWIRARDDAKTSKRFLILFIENKDAREQMIKSHDEFMRKHGEA